MKVRKDFVTNSSSSSFICEICGAEASGWDMTLWEAEMVRCKNNHLFCEDEMIEKSAEWWFDFLQRELGVEYDDASDVWGMKSCYLGEYEERYSVHESLCPICQMQVMNDTDFMNYMSKKLNMTKDDVLKEIQESFGTYQKFKEWLWTKE